MTYLGIGYLAIGLVAAYMGWRSAIVEFGKPDNFVMFSANLFTCVALLFMWGLMLPFYIAWRIYR